MDQNMKDESQKKELEQRHQETAEMSKILEMVAPMDVQSSSQAGSSIEFGGLQEELDKIKRDQDSVLRQLEHASSTSTAFSPDNLPPVLKQILGTWKTSSPRDPSSASLSYFPPAFLFGFMWFKLDGYHLHCVFFNGMDHEKSIDAIGVECDGAVEGSRKMTYVEGDRLITSHRMVADGSEYMRIERYIVEDRLHFVFRRGDSLVCTRIYEKAFKAQ